jgi:hypothetical protein
LMTIFIHFQAGEGCVKASPSTALLLKNRNNNNKKIATTAAMKDNEFRLSGKIFISHWTHLLNNRNLMNHC